jgi:hypothetical protein
MDRPVFAKIFHHDSKRFADIYPAFTTKWIFHLGLDGIRALSVTLTINRFKTTPIRFSGLEKADLIFYAITLNLIANSLELLIDLWFTCWTQHSLNASFWYECV